ncbi:hypothetical protein JZ751_014946 [Albula glossodonta]|uniref:Rho guanine nucleotide exchange factor 16 n=1 Tax=Albula glossodonta TaxID=121402 RepID=A0A8T2N8L6_9TELE|nr:hypothetical protein JZ751_014946 [Albula glossodonta]
MRKTAAIGKKRERKRNILTRLMEQVSVEEPVCRRLSLEGRSVERGQKVGDRGDSQPETLSLLLTLPLSPEPRLYQEIRERGLHCVDEELLDDPTQVEQEVPDRDQHIVVKSFRPTQVTWSQLPEVRQDTGLGVKDKQLRQAYKYDWALPVQEMGILQSISAEERKRQEAMFELITSEFSYLHSLGILVRKFKGSEELRRTMTATEHHHLFSNITDIHAVSHRYQPLNSSLTQKPMSSARFFEQLDSRHQDNPLIKDINDIVQIHATLHFQPYITYCSNETFQQKTLQKLLAANTAFRDVLKRIENSTECGGLPVISFLILPMQRVTRLPLLMDTICQKTNEETAEYTSAVRALNAINKLVKKCNDGARTMERTEQMYTIQKQMDFGKIKPFPLVSSSRWLQKRGELAVCTEDLSIFWKTFGHKSYYLFLFNDVLIVTRRKSEESYVVMDYATLENVEVELSASARQSGSSPHTLKLLMKKNSEGRAEQIALAAESLSVPSALIISYPLYHRGLNGPVGSPLCGCTSKLIAPAITKCEVTKAYMPKNPDELGLQQAEVVIILQREDGWCHGERMRDGERGWFPEGYATEITDCSAVQRNVRRMERMRKETNV